MSEAQQTQMNEEIIEQNEYEQEDEEFSSEKEESKEDKYKDGEVLTFVRVRFPGNAKSFPFLVGKRKFSYGQKVIAMSDRGMTVGYINSFPYQKSYNSSMKPVRSIAKTAGASDIQEQQEYANQVKKAEILCIGLIDKLKLDMTLTHVEIIHFGKKAVFYFMAPERVDFRELVKALVSDLKMRIELRQISLRDRTAALGGIGVCGLQTCCSSFLQNYGNVTIKMAKNQNLALIPSKVNGICGQLKCCIKYEDEVYSEKRLRLPKEGELIKTHNGDFGKVTRLHVLIEQFEMLTSEGQRRLYVAAQYNPDFDVKTLRYPETFENIINETSKLIGAPEIKEIQSAPENVSLEESELEKETEHEESEQVSNLDTDEKVEATSEEQNSKDNFEEEEEQQEEDLKHEKERKKNKFNKKQKRFQQNRNKR